MQTVVIILHILVFLEISGSLSLTCWYIYVHWIDMLHMKFSSSNKGDKPNTRSRLHITTQKVDQETKFIILASDGVWEVRRNQEAMDLVGHIVDAQKAAECLAEEALK
ncbi:putative protein phosphatase 2C-like protein 44 [Iris pallida]|uniref:protein-serine/threonine phosphatase n=1 Tax=Iris pallida TaxID=29817 RepID=A0AAX6F236_IRIPA|nr:putative protein phosphatase 2C-like protein 44 [Iris pallida]